MVYGNGNAFSFLLTLSATHKEARMNCEHAFDIFKRLPSGNPLWITAVQDLVEAKKRMTHLAVISPAEYFIYSQGNGIVAELAPDVQECRR
jgi:hypothetical protein